MSNLPRRNGGPAFPVEHFAYISETERIVPSAGMSLRAAIALAALPGLIQRGLILRYSETNKEAAQELARSACTIADAVLAELEREDETC
jgi:hypothetical protein